MSWQFWSLKEKELLMHNHNELTPIELNKLLLNRTINSVINQLNRLNLFPQNRTCHYCKKKFNPKRRSQIYCCPECGGKKYRETELMKSKVVIQTTNRTQRKL